MQQVLRLSSLASGTCVWGAAKVAPHTLHTHPVDQVRQVAGGCVAVALFLCGIYVVVASDGGWIDCGEESFGNSKECGILRMHGANIWCVTLYGTAHAIINMSWGHVGHHAAGGDRGSWRLFFCVAPNLRSKQDCVALRRWHVQDITVPLDPNDLWPLLIRVDILIKSLPLLHAEMKGLFNKRFVHSVVSGPDAAFIVEDKLTAASDAEIDVSATPGCPATADCISYNATQRLLLVRMGLKQAPTQQ